MKSYKLDTWITVLGETLVGEKPYQTKQWGEIKKMRCKFDVLNSVEIISSEALKAKTLASVYSRPCKEIIPTRRIKLNGYEWVIIGEVKNVDGYINFKVERSVAG